MRPVRLTLIALAAALSVGPAYADSPRATEVIVVTAPKPEKIETSDVITIEQVSPKIDYTSLAIEAPRIDRPEIKVERRTEVVLGNAGNSKS